MAEIEPTEQTADDSTEDVDVVPDTGTFAEATTTASYGSAIQQDYSQYRALVPLTVMGAPAFAAGAPVPGSHPMVESWLREGGLLERVG